MAEPKHTRGPWRISKNMLMNVLGPNGLIVADCNVTSMYRKQPTDERMCANATLIAQAPALLDWTMLLERSLVYQIKKYEIEGDDEGARLQSLTLAMVRDTIAKATT